MLTYLNETGVPLSVAVYLACDHYDYVPDAISATSLIKPLKQLILSQRVPPEQRSVDILSVVKSRMGSSIHDGIERAWVGHYERSMQKLGYPQSVIDRIVVNPTEPLAPDAIPVYMEKRSFREINGFKISGKFDFVADGRLEDFKSTSAFTWVNETKTDDYKLQGSIYRWLNPDIITKDHMAIQFFFTDWASYKANEPGYPSRQVEQKLIPLLSLEQTEDFIIKRLDQIKHYTYLDQDQLPRCTDDELWRKEPAYKYYKNPSKRTRSTKNFTTLAEANARLAEDGNVGIVVEVPGQVVACKYCPAFPVCTQKDEYLADGSLQL